MKFQRTRWETLVENVRLGMTQERAAESVGISEQTLYNWIKKAKNADSPEHVEFYIGLREASAACEMRYLSLISEHAEVDWRAAMAILERRFSKDWGKKIHVETDWDKQIRDLGLDPEEVLNDFVEFLGAKLGGLESSDTSGDGEVSEPVEDDLDS